MREHTGRELHLFIIGELTVDGRKSQWRLDFEQYMKEKQDKARINPPVKPNPVVQKVRAPKPPKPVIAPRACSRCGVKIKHFNAVGRCSRHYKDSRMIACKVEGCTKLIHSDNRFGACTPHRRHLEMLEKRVPRNKCQHPNCLELLTRKNTLGLCRWHGPWKNKAENKRTSPKMLVAA